jgi:hypothetical protein
MPGDITAPPSAAAAAAGKLQEPEEGVIEVRVGESIAGRVAQTGQTMNIGNAYDEPLFNALSDQKTGFRTRQML